MPQHNVSVSIQLYRKPETEGTYLRISHTASDLDLSTKEFRASLEEFEPLKAFGRLRMEADEWSARMHFEALNISDAASQRVFVRMINHYLEKHLPKHTVRRESLWSDTAGMIVLDIER